MFLLSKNNLLLQIASRLGTVLLHVIHLYTNSMREFSHFTNEGVQGESCFKNHNLLFPGIPDRLYEWVLLDWNPLVFTLNFSQFVSLRLSLYQNALVHIDPTAPSIAFNDVQISCSSLSSLLPEKHTHAGVWIESIQSGVVVVDSNLEW